MPIHEYSAMLGIDLETAPKAQIAKRVFEVCSELADCYDEGSLEAVAFQSIQTALLIMNGGTFKDADS